MHRKNWPANSFNLGYFVGQIVGNKSDKLGLSEAIIGVRIGTLDQNVIRSGHNFVIFWGLKAAISPKVAALHKLWNVIFTISLRVMAYICIIEFRIPIGKWVEKVATRLHCNGFGILSYLRFIHSDSLRHSKHSSELISGCSVPGFTDNFHVGIVLIEYFTASGGIDILGLHIFHAFFVVNELRYSHVSIFLRAAFQWEAALLRFNLCFCSFALCMCQWIQQWNRKTGVMICTRLALALRNYYW